jgi:hypothetical protein
VARKNDLPLGETIFEVFCEFARIGNQLIDGHRLVRDRIRIGAPCPTLIQVNDDKMILERSVIPAEMGGRRIAGPAMKHE